MTRDDFQRLAQAHGGDTSRWPPEAQDDAALLMATDPTFVRQTLEAEGRLDAVLDRLPRPRADADLIAAIVASAPAARPRRSWLGWMAPTGLGAGLAAACAAGLLVGASLAGQMGDPAPEASALAELEAVFDLEDDA